MTRTLGSAIIAHFFFRVRVKFLVGCVGARRSTALHGLKNGQPSTWNRAGWRSRSVPVLFSETPHVSFDELHP